MAIFNNTQTISPHRMLDTKNTTIWNDWPLLARSQQPNWLSKSPTNNREEKLAEEYLNYIISTSTPKAIRVDKVATETTKDLTLTAIIKAITTNKPTMMTLTNKNYGSSSKLSLAHNGNIILKRYQIVLLQIFQAQAIKFAQTTALLWEKVLFWGMQTLVEHTIKNYFSC